MQDKQGHVGTIGLVTGLWGPPPSRVGLGRERTLQEAICKQGASACLFSCLPPSLCFPPKCESTFLYSSHSSPDSQATDSDTFCNFTVFSFPWVIYLECWLGCLIFLPLQRAPKLLQPILTSPETGDRHEAGRSKARVGVEWLLQEAGWVTEARGSEEEGEDGRARAPGRCVQVGSLDVRPQASL